ncbi:predicted protein [Sclerotinia sclerotiorum 1980 UF-70]|uniref:Uncharacterized protein n=2 Tax=Sclerotinia sclerotiorum (strain ATCC 18683 / 1980 / Ss-1) TaxID=665079 RepID=A7E7A7_SCLS1|nr:predicted protein [Sclerotinia sclerotiorum 1980 UF-70]APA06305.1 hypothetical protein sscle_01g010750 [Sclerotinia sclerotiorum 1980 UF-70]EDN96259.1 predicted protein [Sclerotinia sclerotiorum 1980 UF-70]
MPTHRTTQIEITHPNPLSYSPTSFPHQISTCELCTRKFHPYNNFSGTDQPPQVTT